MLFHLPVEYRSGARLLQVEAAINRLVKRHGVNIWGPLAVDLKVYSVPERPLIPDGLYLIKGGNREVWKQFRIRTKMAAIPGDPSTGSAAGPHKISGPQRDERRMQ